MLVIGLSSPCSNEVLTYTRKINNMNRVQHLSKYHNTNISLFNESNIENA